MVGGFVGLRWGGDEVPEGFADVLNYGNVVSSDVGPELGDAEAVA